MNLVKLDATHVCDKKGDGNRVERFLSPEGTLGL